MKNKLIIPLLLLALVVTAGWGYSQYQTKRQWEVNAENQYQQSFEELIRHVSNMETSMSKALVAGSFPQSIRLLTDCWRESNSSQENLGQLPLTSVDLSRTKMLLAKVSTFCFNTAQNGLVSGDQPDSKEWSALQNLRDQTQIILKHVSSLREQFYSSRARWLEVDRLGPIGASGLASNSLNNNKVTKAFLMLEDGLRRVPDIQFEGNNLGFVPKATGLTGKNVSSREAVAIARRFLGPNYKNATIKYDRLIHGGFPSYMVTATDPRRKNQETRLSISVKGGHVAWMLANRSVVRPRINLIQAREKGKAFLDRNGYSNMEPVSDESFANIATITFVPRRNKILHYPEMIKLQVAQDNGEILGMDAIALVTFNNPKAPAFSNPKINEGNIRKLLNPNLEMKKIQLAQVLDEMYNKVLCYEVDGTLQKDRYLIYYNANTGREEKIRKVDARGNEVG